MIKELKWDGSPLTAEILSELTLEELVVEKFGIRMDYLRITDNQQRIYTLLFKSSQLNYCLIDQFKPVFGLPTLGCHYYKKRGRFYILIKTRYILHTDFRQDQILEHPTFDIGYLNYYLKDVVKILLFRALLGITPNNLTSIKVKLNEDASFDLVPDYTTQLKPYSSVDRIFTDMVYRKFILVYPDLIKECLKEMIGPISNQYGAYRYRIQNGLIEVLKRCQAKNTSIVNLILNRIGIVYSQFV